MKTGHDLMGLIKFLGRDGWKEPFQSVLDEHFGPATKAFALEYDDIGDLLGDQWAMTLWGCAFEDFLTRRLEPDGRNLVDVYLKRRGWKEGAQTRAYMTALRNSIVSLYEVSAIVPGQSLLARDLIRGGEPVRVNEGTATKTLKSWDRIAARIVPRGDGHMFGGGLLPFSPEAAAMVRDGLQDVVEKQGASLDDDKLRRAAPLFTIAWLFDVAPKAMGEGQPVLHNGDGEAVVFHEVRFPLAAGFTQNEIGARLDALKDLQRESGKFWNWLGDSPRKRPRAGKDSNAVSWDVTMENGAPVLGNVVLKGRFLILSVNSAGRAAQGTALLQGALDESVLAPLTGIMTLDQMRESHRGKEARAPKIPPEIATPIVHEMLDRQYRETLDGPVGMIGDVSPRVAVKTAKGRAKVADWLKYLENRSATHLDPNDPMATYDFGWLWRELGIESLRQ
jgi:hypothetical protein